MTYNPYYTAIVILYCLYCYLRDTRVNFNISGDETKSMVSDTWSTDVLASDSETVEQSDISSQMSQVVFIFLKTFIPKTGI